MPTPAPDPAQLTAVAATPRASYLCEPCHQRGKMPEPVELAIGAAFCPMCGKKKGLMRVWGGPAARLHTARGVARFVDKLTEPYYKKQRDAQYAAERAVATDILGNPIPKEHQRDLRPHFAPTGVAAQALGLPGGGGRPGNRLGYRDPDVRQVMAKVISAQIVPVPPTAPRR